MRAVRLFIAIAAFASLACQQQPETRPPRTEVDGLDTSAVAYVGQLLEVRPFHGYGWDESRLQGQGYSRRAIAPPQPFKVRLKRLWSFRDAARRGGVAQVEMPGHPFEGMWLTFSTRHEGRFNFTDRLGAYNADLGSREPTASNDEGWPTLPKGTLAELAYSGYAEIVAIPSK
jgi:hypothetical protein